MKPRNTISEAPSTVPVKVTAPPTTIPPLSVASVDVLILSVEATPINPEPSPTNPEAVTMPLNLAPPSS